MSETPRPGPRDQLWIDLVDPSPADIERVSLECGLAVPDRAALEEVEASSRLRGDDRALYLSMPLAVRKASEILEPMPFGFILTPDVLVTVRYGEVPALAQVRVRFAATPPSSSSEAFVTLIETLIDIGADLLESAGGQLAGLSARIFRSPELLRPHDKRPGRELRGRLRKIGALGDDLSHLRETLLGLQRIVAFVSERAVGGLPPAVASRLKTTGADIASLIDFESHLTNKTQFLLDAILGFITTEQNDIFKLLTIVSVAGIPPTLIASLYGMNFHVMPELGWRFGYPFALALILLSALLPMLWFRKRGWW